MESLVSDIPAGDGKIANLFLQCSTGVKMELRSQGIGGGGGVKRKGSLGGHWSWNFYNED
jgi:hypothetical protein